ncbi:MULTISPECIES: hypothetical protein [unclassified Nocardiopsis]|uniref:hypothetical protein n=1 Tax=unclassified Nocardiopsis TaxID=2649073 RepID=UPI001357CFFE|nr:MULTISPECIES: hypothetical protein [unclassified Nocardiopsis]
MTVDDIAARTGRVITGALEAQVQAWISDALARASPYVPELDVSDLPPGAHAVLAAAVARCVYNPAGVHQYRAGTVSFTAGAMAGHGGAGPVLAPADIDALRAAYGKASAYSVRTPSRRPYVGDRRPRRSLDTGGESA